MLLALIFFLKHFPVPLFTAYVTRSLELPLTLGNNSNHTMDTDFFDFDFNYSFPNQKNLNTQFEFKDFEDVFNDICSWDCNLNPPTFLEDLEMDIKPLMNYSSEVPTINETQREFKNRQSNNGRSSSKSSTLELDEIKKYFDVPISKAAKELKVGLTVLKKRCRELNIMRWPHRKIKSLKSLIDNVKELGLTSEIAMLEEHKRVLEKIPELELTERTKKLRQACFKANYKKRRSNQTPFA